MLDNNQSVVDTGKLQWMGLKTSGDDYEEEDGETHIVRRNHNTAQQQIRIPQAEKDKEDTSSGGDSRRGEEETEEEKLWCQRTK